MARNQHITIQTSQPKPQSARAAWYFALPAAFTAAFCLFAAGYALFTAGFFQKGDLALFALFSIIPVSFFSYVVWGRGKVRFAVAAIGLLGFGLYLLYNWRYLFLGLNSLILWIVERVNLYYYQNFQTVLPMGTGFQRIQGELHFYLFICVFMGFILVSSLSMKRGILWLTALLAPCFWVACNLCEVPQRIPILLLFLAFSCGFTLCASRYKRGRTGGGVDIGFHEGGFLGSPNVMVFNSKGSGGSIFMWVNGLIALIATVAILFFPQANYNTAAPLEKLAQDPQTFVENLQQNVLPGLMSGQLGVNGGKLNTVGRHGTTYATHLKLEGEYIVPMFLKGYTGAVYEENRWADLPTESYDKLANIAKEYEKIELTLQTNTKPFLEMINDGYSLAIANPEDQLVFTSKLAISNVSANTRFAYLPYNNLSDPFSDKRWGIDQYKNDSFVSGQNIGREAYSISYMLLPNLAASNGNGHIADISLDRIPIFQSSDGSTTNSTAFRDMSNSMRQMYETYPTEGAATIAKEQVFSKALMEYEDFVFENYLEVPYDMADFKEKAQGLSGNPEDFVKQYLWEHAVYDYNPGSVPKDKDYVDYFLYENHRGYCTHFATAGTLLFRSLGIPARYVEGYVVTAQDIEPATQDGTTGMTATVPDANAHSWVEIWQGILGWQPVEVTPGFSGSSIAPPAAGEALPPAMTSSMVESSAPTSSEIPSDISSEDVLSSDAASSAMSSNLDEEQDGVAQGSRGLNKAALILLSIVGGVALAVGLLYAASLLAAARRKRQRKLKDTSLCAIHGYKYLTSQVAFLGYRLAKGETEKQFAIRLSNEVALPLRERIEEVTLLALRASFGGNPPLTREQAEHIWTVADQIRSKLTVSLPIAKRLIFRLLL